MIAVLACIASLNAGQSVPPQVQSEALRLIGAIRSYAIRLPVGCSSIEPGSLQVIEGSGQHLWILRAGEAEVQLASPEYTPIHYSDKAFSGRTTAVTDAEGAPAEVLASIARRASERVCPPGYEVGEIVMVRRSSFEARFFYRHRVALDPEVEAHKFGGSTIALDPVHGGVREMNLPGRFPAPQRAYLSRNLSRAQAEARMQVEFARRWPEVDFEAIRLAWVYQKPEIPFEEGGSLPVQAFVSPRYRRYIAEGRPRVVFHASPQAETPGHMEVLLDGQDGEVLLAWIAR